MISASDHWGPFSPAISHPERVARLRALRAIAQLYCGVNAPLVKALWLAESGDMAELEAALIELDGLPARRRRTVLASYNEHQHYETDGKKRKQLEGAG